MAIEAWLAIAKRFSVRYGVEVMVGGDRALSTETTIYLPGDVPDDLIDAMHGLFLHEKEHILQKDHKHAKDIAENDAALSLALNVVHDIHNDTLVLEQDPGAESLYRTINEYLDRKLPWDKRKGMPWKQKAVQELLLRALPLAVRERQGYTDDPRVKHFIKANRKDIGKMLRDLKDLRPDREAQEKWARWILERLFGDIIQVTLGMPGAPGSGGGAGGAGGAGGIPWDQLPPQVKQAVQDAIDSLGGLVPKRLDRHGFKCIAPGDLKQKVPEAVTVQRLKEFLTELLEQPVPEETGSIDPTKLPTYWQDSDDMFLADKDKKVKRVEVVMLVDASGSMNEPLPDNTRRYQALVRAVGLVAQAVERTAVDEGMDVTLESWAFGSKDRLVKGPEERWDPGEFKMRYWTGGDNHTNPAALIRQVAGRPRQAGTKLAVIIVTDGYFTDDGNAALEEARVAGSWALVGIGAGVGDPTLFRFIADSLDQIEYILCQCVKEATA